MNLLSTIQELYGGSLPVVRRRDPAGAKRPVSTLQTRRQGNVHEKQASLTLTLYYYRLLRPSRHGNHIPRASGRFATSPRGRIPRSNREELENCPGLRWSPPVQVNPRARKPQENGPASGFSVPTLGQACTGSPLGSYRGPDTPCRTPPCLDKLVVAAASSGSARRGGEMGPSGAIVVFSKPD